MKRCPLPSLLCLAVAALVACQGGAADSPDAAAADAARADAALADAAPDTCPDGLRRCGDVCVDVAGDPRHCGDCARACETGQTCAASRCELPPDCRVTPCTGFTYCDLATGVCLPGCIRDEQCTAANEVCDPAERDCACEDEHHRCDTACVPDVSTETCGTSCTPCPAPRGNGRATCDGERCAIACDDRYHQCGTDCLSNSSVDSCGASCTPCPDPANGAPTCNGTVCGIRCDSGYHQCGQACASNTSVATCGASCTPCPVPANGAATCNGTTCGIACDDGYHQCGSLCSASDSPETCGTRCTPCPAPANATATCDAGACGYACNAGYYQCTDRCTTLVPLPLPRTTVPGTSEPSDLVLTTGSDRQPRVLFYRPTDSTLRLVERRASGTWTPAAEVAWAPNRSGDMSIAVDGARTHVTFVNRLTNNHLVHVEGDGAGFTQTPIAPDDDVTAHAVTLDAARGVHVVYVDRRRDGVLRHAYRPPGGAWTYEDVGPRASVTTPAITVDRAGVLHVLYASLEAMPGLLYTARAPGGTWSAPAVVDTDPLRFGPEPIAVASDASGDLHVAYSMNSAARYAQRSPAGVWTRRLLRQDASITSVAIDAAGAPHVGVFTYTGEARYLYRNPAGSWSDTHVTGIRGGVFIAVAATGAHIITSDTTGLQYTGTTFCP